MQGGLGTLVLSTQLWHAGLLQNHAFQRSPAAAESTPPYRGSTQAGRITLK